MSILNTRVISLLGRIYCYRRFAFGRACSSVNCDQKWMSVVGLEIHAQIWSKSKLFSRSSTQYGQPVNSQVSLFDCSMPGTLPQINRKCVEAAVLTALALNCKVNKISNFDRKHYFYADLPCGYQITQHRNPIAENGLLSYSLYNPSNSKDVFKKSVSIIQLQLEQDSGKSLHDEINNVSLIDLNRAGIGLMEIVTAPDFNSGFDAAMFVKELQSILRSLKTCNGKMSEGSLRVDANVSVNTHGDCLGTRTEIKNINSLRGVTKAIDFEIHRQIEVLENGGKVSRETRAYDSSTEETVALRDKEDWQDYRFMPEPNLPPLRLYTNSDLPLDCVEDDQVINIDSLRLTIPELPEARRDRLEKTYDISQVNSYILVNDPQLADYFELIVEHTKTKGNNRYIVNLLLNDYLGLLNSADISFVTSPVKPEQFASICDLVNNDTISHDIAKKLLGEVISNPHHSVSGIIEHNQWFNQTDDDIIENVLKRVINDNPDSLKAYLSGKSKSFNFIMGQARKALPENANPKKIAEILKRILHEHTKR